MPQPVQPAATPEVDAPATSTDTNGAIGPALPALPSIDYLEMGRSIFADGPGPTVPDALAPEGGAEATGEAQDATQAGDGTETTPAPAAAPTAAPAAPQAGEPPADDKLSRKFAALSKREQTALDAEKRAKDALAEIQKHQEALKGQLEQAASLKAIAQTLEKDPIAALRHLGADPMKVYQRQVEAFLSGGTATEAAEPATAATANPEIAAIRKQLEEVAKANADLKAALEQKDQLAAAAQWRSEVSGKIASNPDRYRALSRLGAERAISTVENAYVRHVQATNEDVPLDTIVEWVNDAIQREAQQILGASAPAAPNAAPVATAAPPARAGLTADQNEVSPPERMGKGMTLTHASAASGADNPEPPKSPADMARALARARAEAESVLKRGW